MRVLVFSDEAGLPLTVPFLKEHICGLVAASIRSHSIPYVENMAEEIRVPFHVHPKKSETDTYQSFLGWIKALDPDFFFVHSYSMKLHSDLLNIPKKESVNVHSGLVPYYRGANPIQWAMINGEKFAGVTMHYMTSDIDAGDIISQKKVPVHFKDTWIEVRDRLAGVTKEMLNEQIPKLLDGSNTRTPQNLSEGNYYHRRRPEDGLIDWNWTEERIYNFIRALVSPLPGAFYYKESIKVVIDQKISLDEVRKLKNGMVGETTSVP